MASPTGEKAALNHHPLQLPPIPHHGDQSQGTADWVVTEQWMVALWLAVYLRVVAVVPRACVPLHFLSSSSLCLAPYL